MASELTRFLAQRESPGWDVREVAANPSEAVRLLLTLVPRHQDNSCTGDGLNLLLDDVTPDATSPAVRQALGTLSLAPIGGHADDGPVE